MKSSPPLKAKLLFDDAYRPQPSPPLGAHTEPLLQRDTLRISLVADDIPAPWLPVSAEAEAARAPSGLRARLAAACDDLPTPRDVCKALVSPCRSRTGYLRRMRTNFGLPFLLMLTSVYLLVKGMLVQIITLAKLPYYKQAGVGPRAYQQYDIVTRTPWALKACFGAMSDLLPLCGYSKQSYMSLVSLIGGASCVLLAVATNCPSLWASAASLASVPAITIYFFGVNLQAAVVDLLAEGRYTAAMAAVPWSGSDCVSWVWACVQAGAFLSAVLVGWAADSHSIHLLFPLAAVLALQVLPLSEAGALGDVRLPPGQRGFQRAKFDDNPRVFVLAGLMALAGLGMGGCNFFGASNALLLGASLGSSVLLCALAFWALPLVLAKANLYLYLCSVLYVQVSGAVDFFYVAPPSCVPDGPHFSFRYYITYSAIVQSLFGYIGVVLFQAFMRKWHFRAVLASTVLLQVLAGAVDLVIVQRWNVHVLGIPDNVMYMLGFNVVYQIASMLNFMPSVILTSKLCPPQMEATMFALLAGFQNFGSMVAGTLGVVLINALGIHTGQSDAVGAGQSGGADGSAGVAPPPPPAPVHAGHAGNTSSALAAAAATTAVANIGAAGEALPPSECDFSMLPYAIVLSHMLLPLLCIPLGYLLLPDARLTDEIKLSDDGVHHVPRAKPPRQTARELLVAQKKAELEGSAGGAPGSAGGTLGARSSGRAGGPERAQVAAAEHAPLVVKRPERSSAGS